MSGMMLMISGRSVGGNSLITLDFNFSFGHPARVHRPTPSRKYLLPPLGMQGNSPRSWPDNSHPDGVGKEKVLLVRAIDSNSSPKEGALAFHAGALGGVSPSLRSGKTGGCRERAFSATCVTVGIAMGLLLTLASFTLAGVGGQAEQVPVPGKAAGVSTGGSLPSASITIPVRSELSPGPVAQATESTGAASESQGELPSVESSSGIDSAETDLAGQRGTSSSEQGNDTDTERGKEGQSNQGRTDSGNLSSAGEESGNQGQSGGGNVKQAESSSPAESPTSSEKPGSSVPNARRTPAADVPVNQPATPGPGGLKAEPSAEGPYLLRYRFHPGEEVRWEVLQQARVKTTVGGTTQVAESVTQSVKLWRIRECHPDGTVTFDHLVESVEMWQKLTGREEVRYSSRSPGDPPRGFEAIAASLNVPLATVTMDARGQILKRVRHPVKTPVDTEPLMTILLPEEPVLPGASWSFPYEVEIPLENGTLKVVKAIEIYKLREVKSGVATIEIATKVLTPINDPRLEAKLVQREREGVAQFDIEAGRLIRQQIELDRRVTGFSGPASLLQYSGRLTESFLSARTETARVPAATPSPR